MLFKIALSCICLISPIVPLAAIFWACVFPPFIPAEIPLVSLFVFSLIGSILLSFVMTCVALLSPIISCITLPCVIILPPPLSCISLPSQLCSIILSPCITVWELIWS